ncbi:MAG: AAA family ATPase [Candidatus Marithrix sp.]|nr:AAA family ATPase [Candidatus Marithrix sp.]
MKKIHYLKIQNFKLFEQAITIYLEQPTVLIGPNNSGKTTIIQALALWRLGITKWYGARFNNNKTSSIALNRLDILPVPVPHTKYFWQNLSLRKKNSPILMTISVGVEYNGQIIEYSLNFKYSSSEVIYFQPAEDCINNKPLLEYINELKIEILYPIGNIAIEEPLLQEGRINVLIGEGNTSDILRNFCYRIIENDEKNKTKDWLEITQLMQRLFQIELKKPTYLNSRGSIELKYSTVSIKDGLDITIAGRGQQQVLLLISYLFLHKNTVLLLDEPDAHLEILRQRQIFTLLNHIAQKHDNQIIIATHSEVILENTVESNLVMLIDGEANNLAKKSVIKKALKDFGIEHYYKAKITNNILYVEGSTDIEMLKAFTDLLDHPMKDYFLTNKLNYYFVKDSEPKASFEKEIDKATGSYQSHKKHFYALKAVIPRLTGIAIFDGDNQKCIDEIKDDLVTVYWKKYELENYFIFPEVIEAFVQANSPSDIECLKQAVNKAILVDIFNNDEQAYKGYLKLPAALRRQTFINNTQYKKLSEFLDHVWDNLAELTGKSRILNKGQYYQLIQYLPKNMVDTEIVEKLGLFNA